MAFTDKQIEEITSMMDVLIERLRPPENLRHRLDVGWRIERQSVFLYEIRPQWNDPTIIREHDFAKATWVQKEKEWHVYWVRSDLKWYRYEGLESVVNLQRFMIEVEKDPHYCFRG
jgi:hypothetical protein